MRTGPDVQHTGRALEPYVLKQAEAATEIQSAEMGPDMKSKHGAFFWYIMRACSLKDLMYQVSTKT